MPLALIYLIRRFCYRLYRFFYDWYIGGFLFFYAHGLEILESQDRFWAIRITAKNLFEPLYKDETMVGRILGFIFRSGRIVLAFFIYMLIILIAAIGYLAFAALPLYVIYYGLAPFFPNL